MTFYVSDNIQLAPLSEHDALDVLTAVNANRDMLAQYLYWVDSVKCVASAKKYINDRVNSGLPFAQWYKVLLDEQLAGVFAIKSINEQTLVAELGYWLTSQAQGKGVIAQIIDKLPELCFEPPVKEIEFRCLSENHASIKVAKKSGATLIEVIPHFMEINGVEQDLNVYQAALY